MEGGVVSFEKFSKISVKRRTINNDQQPGEAQEYMTVYEQQQTVHINGERKEFTKSSSNERFENGQEGD